MLCVCLSKFHSHSERVAFKHPTACELAGSRKTLNWNSQSPAEMPSAYPNNPSFLVTSLLRHRASPTIMVKIIQPEKRRQQLSQNPHNVPSNPKLCSAENFELADHHLHPIPIFHPRRKKEFALFDRMPWLWPQSWRLYW